MHNNTTTPPLFDLIAGLELKAQGKQRAAKRNDNLLELARSIAVEIAERQGTVTADDVQLKLHERGYSIRSLGNAAGSLFAGKRWEWTGERIQSRRAHAHGNELKVWRLAR